MDYKELDEFLREITPSEKWHLENPDKLSPFYEKVEKVQVNNELVYLFDFGIKFKKENITINKDTRFTYIPKHIHTDMELNYIYSGRCNYILDGKSIILKKGDICLLDNNQVHGTKYIGENDIVLNISMTRSFFNSSFLTRLSNQGIITSFLINALMEDQNHNKYIIFPNDEDNKIDVLMKNLLCEYYDRNIGYDEVVDAYMIIIFSELVRIFNKNNMNGADINSSDNNIIDFLQYIENYYNNCSLNSMAKDFGYNTDYLGTMLKRKTGKTFSQLKLEYQMREASMLIVHTELPIYDIAFNVGFSNLGFFYKKFREYFKMNPQEYRERFH